MYEIANGARNCCAVELDFILLQKYKFYFSSQNQGWFTLVKVFELELLLLLFSNALMALQS